MTRKLLKGFLLVVLFVVVGVVLTACQQATPEPTQPPAPPQPTSVPCPTAAPCPAAPDLSSEVPYYALWVNSGHADATAQAFRHWDNEDPAEVPVYCAKCHSSAGFLDYLGADGSQAFVVDKAAPTDTVINCNTCHNPATETLTTVKFPSGAELTGLGREAVCMTCHQGNASMVQVDEAIAKAGATDEDAVVGELGFINIHYYAAAVSRYGAQVKGGYQYPGKSYDVLFEHVSGVQACQDCHNSHSLELKTESCVTCHPGANSVEGVRAIRMASSLTDYDGDGDVNEGLADEITGLRDMLYSAIQAYAKEVAGTAIVYDKNAYPYFFIDTNENGSVDEGEAIFPNKYASWTPRLEKAAFNFQVAMKDPGGYAHGGKYIIQLLYDAIENLNEKLSTPVDLSMANRVDAGHFDGSSESFRHWDADGKVPNTCVKCHTADGLPQFIAEGVNISMMPSNGLRCETCHNDLSTFSLYQVETVTFPSGAKLGFENSPNDNLCLNCHQGRESTVSVNRAIAGLEPDTPSDKLTFRNIHYFAAGATLFGSEAQGVYQYAGKEYVGKFEHIPNYQACSDCHDAHKLTVEEGACRACHQVEDVTQIRLEDPKVDYDGDGDVNEGIKGEIDTLTEVLYQAIRAYGKEVAGTPIAYSPTAYPYFFVDTNEDGVASPDEAIFPNRYVSWTPRLLQAAYNYQYAKKDPGGYVHNGKYILQVLYDSIVDLSSKVQVNTANLKRP